MTVNGISGNNPLYGLVSPTTTNAGGTQGTTNQPPQRPTIDQLISQLQAKLGLNDNQMIALKNILVKDMQGNDADAKTASTTQTANTQTTGKAHHGHRGKKGQSSQIQKLNADITSILTPDQVTKFNQMLQQLNQNSKAPATQTTGTTNSANTAATSFIASLGA